MVALSELRAASRLAPAREQTIELLVQGAHCANCIRKIETGVPKLSGVRDARFNLSTGKLTVRGTRLRIADIAVQVESLGFKAQPFEASKAMSADEESERFLLRSLAVAVFGVAFVVPLTDATQALWFGYEDMGPGTRFLLNWIAALIACPAALIASRLFFRSALASLSAGRANMDVPISLAILFSLALSLYQSALGGAQTYFDAAVMLPFLLLIGRYLDLRVRRRASEAARQLIAMQAVLVRRLVPSGVVETVMAGDVAPGDRLLLAAGERSPVDGTVENDATIDTSLVTGESAPVQLVQGSVLRAGSIALDRPITLAVTAAVKDSLIADIARLVEAGQQIRSRYVRLADRAAALYVPIVLSLALAVFVAWIVFVHAPFAELGDQCRRGADRDLSLRARPRRPGRADRRHRRPVPPRRHREIRRCAGAPGRRRRRAVRQDRHAHQRQARTSGRDRWRDAGRCGAPGACQPPSARASHRACRR